jgi:cell division protein FtsB
VGLVARVVVAGAAAAAAAFAVQGGEYSTTDLRAQRARRAALLAEVDTLTHVVDSLRTLERRLRTDPVLQERVAREEFGMVRGDKELLYRFADPRPGGAAGAETAAPRPAGAPR